MSGERPSARDARGRVTQRERPEAGDSLERIAESLERLTDRKPPRVGSSNLDARQFRFADFASTRLLQGIIAAFDREVPSEYWSLDVKEAFPRSLPVAMVSCPCGETPAAVGGVAVTCECGRAFLFTGKAVKVAFSPAPKAQTPAAA